MIIFFASVVRSPRNWRFADPSFHTPPLAMQRTKYVAFHIRRGDFQHKWVKISAEEILQLTEALIPGPRHERVAYIATDEQNLSFSTHSEMLSRKCAFSLILSKIMNSPYGTAKQPLWYGNR